MVFQDTDGQTLNGLSDTRMLSFPSYVTQNQNSS